MVPREYSVTGWRIIWAVIPFTGTAILVSFLTSVIAGLLSREVLIMVVSITAGLSTFAVIWWKILPLAIRQYHGHLRQVAIGADSDPLDK